MAHVKKPSWFKVKVLSGADLKSVEKILDKYSLNSVCSHALCPNRIECYNKKTATFLILGKYCTRECRFCNIPRIKPLNPDPEEPAGVAKAVKELKLEYVVITSVTRDDLDDGGADHFCNVVKEIRTNSRETAIELLIPDFKGNTAALDKIIDLKPDVINHNLETVKRLYSDIREGADYKRSLKILERVKKISDITVKSGIILGMGESDLEIAKLIEDIRNTGCDLLTIGQYLSPSLKHLPVKRYLTPEEFKEWKDFALSAGFKGVKSGPMVRSSYKAKSLMDKVKEQNCTIL